MPSLLVKPTGFGKDSYCQSLDEEHVLAWRFLRRVTLYFALKSFVRHLALAWLTLQMTGTRPTLKSHILLPQSAAGCPIHLVGIWPRRVSIRTTLSILALDFSKSCRRLQFNSAPGKHVVHRSIPFEASEPNPDLF